MIVYFRRYLRMLECLYLELCLAFSGLVSSQSKCLRSRPTHNYSVGTRILGTPCLSQKGDLMGRCFDRDRKNRSPVSHQAWHDKDPSIHKAQNCRANLKKLHTFTGNEDVYILNDIFSNGT